MKILLVEDDSTLRECLKIQLEVLGHEVWEASNNQEACNLLRYGNGPFYVIADGNFPRNTEGSPEALGIGLLLVMSDCIERGLLYTSDDDLIAEARRLGIPAIRKPGKVAEILKVLEGVSTKR